jgi:hypothetical protein
MKAAIRLCVMALLAAAVVAPAASQAQETRNTESLTSAVRAQVLARYRVLVVRNGVVLTPRSGGRQVIEVTDDGVAIDGQVMSGREVREKLGADASLILQLSYASSEELRRAFGPEQDSAPSTSAPPAPDQSASPPTDEPEHDPSEPHDPELHEDGMRHSGGRVKFGGSVTVAENEFVEEAVVAIGGSADVRGRVAGDVVAIGGGIRLGPKAVVDGAVTSIGGGVLREEGSQVRGEVVELGVGGPWTFVPWGVRGFDHDMFSGWFRLLGTGLRISLLLLVTLLIAAIADRPVSRIAARAGDDPWVSGFVGLAAEILFVPVLVVTVVFLAISIIGIPLLLLVPFALVALFLGILMGFTGVARRLGRWAVGEHRTTTVATAVGVVLIVAGAVLARLLSLFTGPFWPVAFAVGAIGLFLEYVAWTVGLGALLLTRFGTRPADTPLWVPPTPPGPPPVPSPVPEAQ